ncbi:MAG: hypothetical protein CFH06_00260 [Alphaproteobacteria bacterium MarineAlpha3_Bin5]|nr:MAG: hypothetical protein CFH06_00260 [Alphaproteobacteria bacterium MarineAlpha3_Bin5]
MCESTCKRNDGEINRNGEYLIVVLGCSDLHWPIKNSEKKYFLLFCPFSTIKFLTGEIKGE